MFVFMLVETSTLPLCEVVCIGVWCHVSGNQYTSIYVRLYVLECACLRRVEYPLCMHKFHIMGYWVVHIPVFMLRGVYPGYTVHYPRLSMLCFHVSWKPVHFHYERLLIFVFMSVETSTLPLWRLYFVFMLVEYQYTSIMEVVFCFHVTGTQYTSIMEVVFCFHVSGNQYTSIMEVVFCFHVSGNQYTSIMEVVFCFHVSGNQYTSIMEVVFCFHVSENQYTSIMEVVFCFHVSGN